MSDTAAASWHGTLNGYNYWRCRCEACRKAQADRQRMYQAKQRDEGKCRCCSRELDDRSTVFCTLHLTAHRQRERGKARARRAQQEVPAVAQL